MRLPEDKREDFKEPKGKLFRESARAFDYIDSIGFEEVITVGDRVSATFIEAGFEPAMMVVDYKVERGPVDDDFEQSIRDYPVPEVQVDNPAGTITRELWEAIRDSEKPVKIIVTGEEDLATLPATLFAPLGSIVVYGQPGEGLVVIEVTEEKKEEFEGYKDFLVDDD